MLVTKEERKTADAFNQGYHEGWDNAVKECAQMIEQMGARYHQGRDLVIAIRKLKDDK